MKLFISCARLVMASAVILASAPTVRAAGTDEESRGSRLEVLPTTLGGVTSVDLRTSRASSPFLLLLDTQVTSVDPDGAGRFPWMRVFGGSSVSVFAVTDSAGRLRVSASISSNPALMGVTFFLQAMTLTPSGDVEATNLATTTVMPGAAKPAFGDHSQSVPADGAAHSTLAGAARDLDDDGDPDLVLVTGPAATIHVYRNDGSFGLTDVTQTAIPAAGQIEASDVKLFDADGDGRPDLFVVGGAGQPGDNPLPNLLLINQGGLVFQPAPLPAVAGQSQDSIVADLDGDGDLDIVLANGPDGVHSAEQPDPNTLLVNQGWAQNGTQGTFVADPAFQAAAWNSPDQNIALAAGDIDNDGDLDLFVGRSDTQAVDGVPGQPNVLLRNDGGLTFVDVSVAQLQPLFSDNTESAQFGDLDGDGWLDLLVANSTVSVPSASSGEYYRNQGGGSFVEDNAGFPQIDESEIALKIGVRLVDVDLDGDLDAVVALHEFFDFDGSSGNPSGTDGDDQLFVNQGGAQAGTLGQFLLDGTFTATGIFISSDHIWADFDLDGDNDLYICNLGGLFGPPSADRLLENLRIP